MGEKEEPNANTGVQRYISKMKKQKSPEGLTSRFELEGERISELEDRLVEIMQSEEQREKGE